jgi:CcmD family protein
MPYLIAAYAVAWTGLFAYLAFIVLRLRNVQTELNAIEQLINEKPEPQDK